MAMLGDDGLGYDLASNLHSHGVLRAWLGDSDYSSLQPHLASSSSWASFMSSPAAGSLLRLQLRVRALLYDKASACLFLDSSTPISPWSLDSSYLQLHADSIYFSLEHDIVDWSRLKAEGSAAISSLQMKFGANLLPNDLSSEGSEESGVGAPDNRQKRLVKTAKQSSILPNKLNQGPRLKRSQSNLYTDRSETSLALQRFAEVNPNSGEGACESTEENVTWYQKCLEKSLLDRMHRFAWRAYQQKLPFKDRESCQRTPQGMASYLTYLGKVHKKRRMFRSDGKDSSAQVNQILENGTKEYSEHALAENSPKDRLNGEDLNLFPEIMFPWNCVPDNPISLTEKIQVHQNLPDLVILDRLQRVSSLSPLSVHSTSKDNLGLRSEFGVYKTRQHHGLYGAFSNTSAGGLRKGISDEQADHLLQQVIVQIITDVGFQGVKQAAMESLSRLFTCHIQKLGSTLRVLVDSYQNQCSQKDLLKMFIRNSGCGDFVELLNVIKSPQQTLLRSNQIQLSTQSQVQQVHLDLKQSPQQLSQQMKLQNMQQLAARRRQQVSTSKGNMSSPMSFGKKLDKERAVGDIKPEINAEPFSPTEPKLLLQNVPLISQQLSPWQQQQMVQVPASHHPYTMQQMKQLSSMPLSSIPQQSLLARDSLLSKIPQVKLEVLHDLIGTDGSVKRESEEGCHRLPF